jgi:hypothetical protein
LTGIDFHLSAEHPATITGRVTGVPPPDPPVSEPAPLNGRLPVRRRGGESVGVNLTPAGETQFDAWSSGAGAQAPDYRFELGENLPGRYRVEATVVAKDRTYSAVQVIDAHEGVNEIVLSLIPAVEVKGHLTVEGTGHGADSFTVMLIPPGLGPRRGTHSSSVQKDGSFAIESVPPGEWLLAINPAAGVFDKSVRLGDRDFLFKHLEIPPGLDVPLNIVVSSNSATISGDVAARAGILLEPLGARHSMTQFYYSAVADDAGKFKLTGVAPGKYKIFALEKIATPSFRNPESADLLDPLGEELEVPEGGKIETHPKLIPEAKAKEILKP